MTAIAGVVGNPKPQSRTLTVARQALTTLEKALVSHGHGVEDQGIVDLAELGAELITGGPGVDAAIATVVGADVLVVASPTYKATYTGLLKLFLDRLPPRALDGHTALPLMVTGSPVHALAVEVHLRPLLVELGATVPTPWSRPHRGRPRRSRHPDRDLDRAGHAPRCCPPAARGGLP